MSPSGHHCIQTDPPSCLAALLPLLPFRHCAAKIPVSREPYLDFVLTLGVPSAPPVVPNQDILPLRLIYYSL